MNSSVTTNHRLSAVLSFFPAIQLIRPRCRHPLMVAVVPKVVLIFILWKKAADEISPMFSGTRIDFIMILMILKKVSLSKDNEFHCFAISIKWNGTTPLYIMTICIFSSIFGQLVRRC
jgi:hypothetical protein